VGVGILATGGRLLAGGREYQAVADAVSNPRGKADRRGEGADPPAVDQRRGGLGAYAAGHWVRPRQVRRP